MHAPTLLGMRFCGGSRYNLGFLGSTRNLPVGWTIFPGSFPFAFAGAIAQLLSAMLILPGASALSVFRAQGLLTKLQNVDTQITEVTAQYLHFVDAAADLSAD